MKAINTEYNGYNFRSRTEARWAVFFDVLGWEYEYEPEGFTLEGGLKYLPDFRVAIPLPNYDKIEDYYVEVKPANKELTDYEKSKIEIFAKRENLLLLRGVPNPNTTYHQLFYWDEDNNGEGSITYIDIQFDDYKYGVYMGELGSYTDRMLEAFKQARSARFEFGETPTVKEVEENKQVKKSKASLESKMEAKKNKKRMEDTHTRSTFLFRNDLKERLEALADIEPRGYKTEFFNTAIETFLDTLDK